MAAVDCDLRAGKSILARCLPTMLPAMTLAEALDTTCIHRVAGLTGARTALVTARPLHAPHHTISDVGLAGGRPSAEAAAPRQSPLSSLGRPTVRPG
jgi:predicted ATPase with chaperone activity